MKNYEKLREVILLLLLGILSSCENGALEPSSPEEQMNTGKSLAKTSAIYSSRSLDFSRPNGTYTQSAAANDFGNISGWDESNMSISSNTAKVKLLKNSLSSACGIVANVDISDGSEYEVQFKVKFHSQFDWSKGGKVGFGFRIGDGNTGCDKADDGNGGSARLMWYNSNGDIKLKPYLYYKDMPDDCGHDFGKKYPSSGSIQRGTWYTVKIYVKSNTGSNTNGRVKYTINDTTVLDTAIRWTTNDSKRLIRKLAFSTFRGGSSSDWESDTDGYIYFDDLTWTKLQ